MACLGQGGGDLGRAHRGKPPPSKFPGTRGEERAVTMRALPLACLLLCAGSVASPGRPACAIALHRPNHHTGCSPLAPAVPSAPAPRILRAGADEVPVLQLRGGSDAPSSSMEDDESSENAPAADREAMRAADIVARPGAWLAPSPLRRLPHTRAGDRNLTNPFRYVQKLGNERHEFRLRPSGDPRAENLTSAITAAGAGQGSRRIFLTRCRSLMRCLRHSLGFAPS